MTTLANEIITPTEETKLGAALGLPEFDEVFDLLMEHTQRALRADGIEGKFGPGWCSVWRDESDKPMLSLYSNLFEVSEQTYEQIQLLMSFCAAQEQVGISMLPGGNERKQLLRGLLLATRSLRNVGDFAGCDYHDANGHRCQEALGPYNAGKTHRFACHTHRTTWTVGANLFSNWRDETEAEQQKRYDEILGYRDIDDGWGALLGWEKP